MAKKSKSSTTESIDPNEPELEHEITSTAEDTIYNESAELSAQEQLEALQEELLGDGPYERGTGSLFARLSDEQKAQFYALDEQIKAEGVLATAQAAAAAAADKTAACRAAVDAANRAAAEATTAQGTTAKE